MKFLVKFESFLISEELTSITDTKSSSGRTRFRHLVFDDPKSPSSFSSSILLKKDLQDQEFLDTIDSISHGNINPEDLKDKKIHQVIYNLRFLKEKKREVGDLHCEYCNKGPLKIYDIYPYKTKSNKTRIRFTKFNKEDGATCDHRTPISKGGDPYDKKNLSVCCYECNQKKGNKSWEDWRELISTE